MECRSKVQKKNVEVAHKHNTDAECSRSRASVRTYVKRSSQSAALGCQSTARHTQVVPRAVCGMQTTNRIMRYVQRRCSMRPVESRRSTPSANSVECNTPHASARSTRSVDTERRRQSAQRGAQDADGARKRWVSRGRRRDAARNCRAQKV